MFKKRGKFLVIEGTDGSGKDTQVRLLIDKLNDMKIPHRMVHFPRYTDNPYGELVRRYLKGEFGGVYDVHTYLASLPYVGDRWLAKDEIEGWIDNGYLVVANRYMASNKAHQGSKLKGKPRKEYIRWLDHLEYEVNKIPKPDLTILLYVTPKTGNKNIGKRGNVVDLGGQKKDIHESNIKYQVDTAKVYLQLAQAEKNWVVLNCLENRRMRSPQQIHEEIMQVLKEKRILKYA